MDDRGLYETILGLSKPWYVAEVEVSPREGEVRVRLGLEEGTELRCPECEERVPGYDRSPERRWRHLDTCQYRTVLSARIPRVECPEHGVRTIRVPWAEDRSRFTALFEAMAIRLLRETTVAGLARLMGLSWDEAEGILKRAVERGLARRADEPIRVLGIDETSFQKRHEYVTVVSDLERGRVLWVGDHRRKATLDAFWSELTHERKAAIDEVVMDMWEPYIRSTLSAVPDAASKIVIDRYHVSHLLTDGVDRVRRAEHAALRKEGDHRLSKTRYIWIKGPRQAAAVRGRADRSALALRPQGGTRLGYQGGGFQAVGVLLARLGHHVFSTLVLLGHPQPAAAHDQGRQNHEALSALDPELPTQPPHKRPRRSAQLQDWS